MWFGLLPCGKGFNPKTKRSVCDQGNRVNFEDPTDEKILIDWKEKPLHVRNSWMHDSMIVIF